MEKGNAVHSAGPNSATARCDRYSPSTGTIIAPHGWALHRRLDAVLLCVEPGGRQFAILMLQRDDEHRDTGLQEADIARAIGQHRHVRANGVFGFGALEPGRTRRDVAAWIVSSLTFQRASWISSETGRRSLCAQHDARSVDHERVGRRRLCLWRIG